MDTIKVVAKDWTALGATYVQSVEIMQRGLAVAWAPRPLVNYWYDADDCNAYSLVSGPAWQGGPILNGFWVSGKPERPLKSWEGKTLGEAWKNMDARFVEIISEVEAEEALKAHIEAHAHTPQEAVEIMAFAYNHYGDYVKAAVAHHDLNIRDGRR